MHKNQKKYSKNLHMSEKSSTFAVAFQKYKLDGVPWGPRKF